MYASIHAYMLAYMHRCWPTCIYASISYYMLEAVPTKGHTGPHGKRATDVGS